MLAFSSAALTNYRLISLVIVVIAAAMPVAAQEFSTGFNDGSSQINGSQASATKIQASAGQLRMLQALQQRVTDNPQHSDGWRSLGRLQTALGDPDSAMSSTLRAIEIDPFNAAAHFDMGQLLVTLDRPGQAEPHFDRVYEIAPASSYAQQLRQQGIEPSPTSSAKLGPPSAVPFSAFDSNPTDTTAGVTQPNFDANNSVQPASYEIQTLDGSDDLKQRFDQLESEAKKPLNRLRVFFETGVLYNSNVTLTPVSRELAQSDSASFQAFANPDLDWKLIRTDTTRLGPMFRGYFTANESSFQEFNLASFQPGVFAEHDFQLGQSEAIGRIEYIFANDLFDGKRVGDRHSATASLTVIRPDLDAFYGYLTLAQSDFRNDGTTPSQTSLDGTTITAGISRFFQTGWDRVPTHSLGVDLESADTKGDDYRYLSLNLHGSAAWQVASRWKFTPTWGLGYRDYADFTGPIARDELFWRVHGRLQYAMTKSVAVALVAGHDRFASDNENFDTERTEGGLVITYTR